MATLKHSVIRSRVDTQIATDLPTWTRGAQVIDSFPDMELADRAHKAYAIGFGRSLPMKGDPVQRTGGAAPGVMSNTELFVKIAYTIRADNAVADYDSALDARQDMVAAVIAARPTTGNTANLHITLVAMLTPLVVDGRSGQTFIATLAFNAQHRLALV